MAAATEESSGSLWVGSSIFATTGALPSVPSAGCDWVLASVAAGAASDAPVAAGSAVAGVCGLWSVGCDDDAGLAGGRDSEPRLLERRGSFAGGASAESTRSANGDVGSPDPFPGAWWRTAALWSGCRRALVSDATRGTGHLDSFSWRMSLSENRFPPRFRPGGKLFRDMR